MSNPFSSSKLVAFIATSDRSAAKEFYAGKLGLRVISEDHFALVLDANGTMVRVTGVQKVAIAEYTILGWEVANIEAAVHDLEQAGIHLHRFEGIGQDDSGIWSAPGGGARVVWFKDPDGNLLSASQHAA